MASDPNTFRTLLDGSSSRPAVISELERIGFEGYLTFECFHPIEHHPEVLIHQTADVLDPMLGSAGLTGVAPWIAMYCEQHRNHDIRPPVHSRGIEPKSSAVRWRGKRFGSWL